MERLLKQKIARNGIQSEFDPIQKVLVLVVTGKGKILHAFEIREKSSEENKTQDEIDLHYIDAS